jgi:hypothetical protein
LNNRNLLDENFFRELSSGGPILLQFMQKLIEEDLLDPNMEISKCSFFCSLCMGEWRKYTSLIQACINKGGDLHKIGPNGMTPLQMLSKLG